MLNSKYDINRSLIKHSKNKSLKRNQKKRRLKENDNVPSQRSTPEEVDEEAAYRAQLKQYAYYNESLKASASEVENWDDYVDKERTTFTRCMLKNENPKAPVRFEDFIYLKVLYQSENSAVLLARHSKKMLFYAMKILNKLYLIRSKSVSHVKNEKSILECLKFPFTVNLQYFFQTKYNLYIAMPFCLGPDVRDYLNARHTLSEREAKFYAAQIILAIEYLHDIDVLHRDIKPENLSLDYDGYLKLTDFGLAKVLRNGRTYTLCGTPEYMAPEVYMSQGYGMSADLWSLAVVIYELIEGDTPFMASHEFKIFEKATSSKYVIPSKFSNELADLMRKLLAHEVGKRYGTQYGGVANIKQHPWFNAIRWNNIFRRSMKAPYIPKLTKIGRLKKLDLSTGIEAPPRNLKKLDKYQEVFVDF